MCQYFSLMFRNIVHNITICSYYVSFLLLLLVPLYRQQGVNAHRRNEGQCVLSSKVPSLNTFNYFNYQWNNLFSKLRNERGKERERSRERETEKRHAGTFPISGSWAAALLSPIVAIMTGDATAATTCSRATTTTSTKATTTTTNTTTTKTTTITTTTTGHKLTAVCWCLRLPSLPMFYAFAYKYTPTHTHTQIHSHVHFSILFSPVVGDKLGNELQFFNLFAATGRKQFCGRPLPGPAELLSLCLFPSLCPTRLLLNSELKADANPLPSQSASFSQCHRAVKSSQRSLSENFLITTSRSLRALLHSHPPIPLPPSFFHDLFMEKIVCEKYGNYAQLAASQIRIPKTLQCHFWTPRINCITNYASKAKKLNTLLWLEKEGRGGQYIGQYFVNNFLCTQPSFALFQNWFNLTYKLAKFSFDNTTLNLRWVLM